MSSRPAILGLTGSMAMGKSTTAAMFAEEGIPTWSADEAVSRLYAPGGEGQAIIGRLCPDAAGEPGQGVDRQRLRQAVSRDRELLGRVERAVHPLVRQDREAFIDQATRAGERLLVVEVPLLFETGGEDGVDATLVVSAPAAVQRQRLRSRGKMGEAELDALLARQMPDEEKRRRADHVINTDTMETAREGVRLVLAEIRSRNWQSK